MVCNVQWRYAVRRRPQFGAEANDREIVVNRLLVRLPISPRGQTRSAFEGRVKGTGLPEPNLGRHLWQRQLGLIEVLHRHIPAQRVLDQLVALPFTQHAPDVLGQAGLYCAKTLDKSAEQRP